MGNTTSKKQPEHLYLFIDEAGDFNFSNTGTKYFVLTAASKTRPFTWELPISSLKYDLIEFGLDIEYFHASEDRQPVRDRFFGKICEELNEMRIDSIVIEKRKTGLSLQVMETFYPMMVGYLLKYILDQRNISNYKGVVVLTDSLPVRKKREAIEKAIKMTVSKMLPPNKKYKVLHHASKSCIGLQVADYCNWAIFRKWERSDKRSYELIKTCIKSEFDIFAKGEMYYY